MMMFFKLPKDLIIKIALSLDLPNLSTFFELNKKCKEITSDNDIFWLNKIITEYELEDSTVLVKSIDQSWKDYYKFIISLTPNDLLMTGSEKGRLDLIKLGLKTGGNMFLTYSPDDYDYIHPLLKACMNGHLKIVEELIKLGINHEYEEEYHISLVMAGYNGYLNIVKYLLNNGLNISTHGENILREVCYSEDTDKDKIVEVVKYLVEEQGVIIDDISFNIACEYGHLKIVKYMINHGYIININNNQGMDEAYLSKHYEIVDFLQDYFAYYSIEYR